MTNPSRPWPIYSFCPEVQDIPYKVSVLKLILNARTFSRKRIISEHCLHIAKKTAIHSNWRGEQKRMPTCRVSTPQTRPSPALPPPGTRRCPPRTALRSPTWNSRIGSRPAPPSRHGWEDGAHGFLGSVSAALGKEEASTNTAKAGVRGDPGSCTLPGCDTAPAQESTSFIGRREARDRRYSPPAASTVPCSSTGVRSPGRSCSPCAICPAPVTL